MIRVYLLACFECYLVPSFIFFLRICLRVVVCQTETLYNLNICMCFVSEVYFTLDCNEELSSIPGPTRHKLFIHKETVEICIDWIDLTSQL